MYIITFLHSQHLETHAGLFYSFKVDLLGKTKGPYPVEREGAFGKNAGRYYTRIFSIRKGYGIISLRK